MSRMSTRMAAIIPVCNRPHAVIEALDSVAAQTRQPKAVVVVDDGSTDDTAARVESWIARHAPTLGCPAKLIRQDNAGAATARNRGVTHAADCDLLAFLDSDDVWPNDYLERMERVFAEAPRAVAASCDKNQFNCLTGEARYESVAYLARDATLGLLTIGPASTSNTVYCARAFQKVGGFEDERVCGEDYQLQLRLSLHGPWLVVPGEPVLYRRHAEPAARETPVQRGEQGDHLSKQDARRRLHRAQFIDSFIHNEWRDRTLPASAIYPRLAKLWHGAGRSLLEQGSREAAADCFRRVLTYRPFHLRARVRLWRCGAWSTAI